MYPMRVDQNVEESAMRTGGDQPEPPGRRDVLISSSPATGRKLGETPITAPSEADRLVHVAREAQKAWFRAGLTERVRMLQRFKDAFYRHMDSIIGVLVDEGGKPPIEALTEFWSCIEMLAFYERLAARTLAPRHSFIGLAPHRMHWIERRPFGVALIIGPWNFPLLLTIAPVAAALVAGNTVILKPSEFAPLSTEAMVACLREAGAPTGVFQIAHGNGDLGAALIDARPDKIVFTGSVATGKKIAQQAARHLIPVTLELGSKDAAIVLEDADLGRAARGIAWGGMYNAGQACLSIELVYAQRPIQAELVRRIGGVIEREVRIGPGESAGATLGAMVTENQVQTIERQVRDAVARGATLIRGGSRIERDNHRYFAPTLITDVTPDMRIMQEETFGPVIAFRTFDDVGEAIREINASPYGLTGSVWTRNRARGLAVASQLLVGHASVNDHVFSASIPHLPWGGTKESGYGSTRGREGLLDMTRPQSFSIERFRPLPSEIVWYPYGPAKYRLLRRLLQALYARGLANKVRTFLRG